MSLLLRRNVLNSARVDFLCGITTIDDFTRIHYIGVTIYGIPNREIYISIPEFIYNGKEITSGDSGTINAVVGKTVYLMLDDVCIYTSKKEQFADYLRGLFESYVKVNVDFEIDDDFDHYINNELFVIPFEDGDLNVEIQRSVIEKTTFEIGLIYKNGYTYIIRVPFDVGDYRVTAETHFYDGDFINVYIKSIETDYNPIYNFTVSKGG